MSLSDILCPKIGVRGQFALSDGCWSFSNAGWHGVTGGNYEFSVADPQKEVPLIHRRVRCAGLLQQTRPQEGHGDHWRLQRLSARGRRGPVLTPRGEGSGGGRRTGPLLRRKRSGVRGAEGGCASETRRPAT